MEGEAALSPRRLNLRKLRPNRAGRDPPPCRDTVDAGAGLARTGERSLGVLSARGRPLVASPLRSSPVACIM